MRQGGGKLADVLARVIEAAQPGVSTAELAALAEELIKKSGGQPIFKGYGGFPAAICISINEAVVHGVPSPKKILKEGDVVGLDIGMSYQPDKDYQPLCLDMARTIGVGKISPSAEQLIEVTKEAFFRAFNIIKPGARIGDVGETIESYVKSYGYQVVKSMSGHGVGYQLHEDPEIPNFGRAGRGMKLKSGMTLAIEPMVCAGSAELTTLDDGWTAVTVDGSLTAHYENTLAVTDKGAEILTFTEQEKILYAKQTETIK